MNIFFKKSSLILYEFLIDNKNSTWIKIAVLGASSLKTAAIEAFYNICIFLDRKSLNGVIP